MVSLVGRTRELRRIGRELDALATGRGGFLELVGEPGIGKTALLAALAQDALGRGFLALRGRASQFELEAPFDPFVDALDDHLASINPRYWQSLGPERLGELAVAFPAMAQLVGGRAPALPSEERYRIHRAVRSLLTLIGSDRPLLLILDDAHWSDQASLELLAYLVRRPPPAAVLVAIACRSGAMPERWTTLADAALREGDLGRIEVGPLSAEDADVLLEERVVNRDLRLRVFEAAGGNPFFMRQVAEAPQVVAAGDAGARGRHGVPQAVLAAIAEEVAALDAATRRVLQAAAVAGDPFDPAFAAAAAGMDEAELLPHLDVLARRGLVHVADSPRRFQFRHPLVWRGVYEDAPAGWRLSAHGRLAGYLAARGTGPNTRAPHVEAAAQPGDREAVDLLRSAAESAMASAPASAIHWFEAALRLLPDDSTHERIALLVPMATTLGSVGRLEESRDRLRQAYRLISPTDEAMRVEALVGWATMENLLRNLPEATRLLTNELDALRHPESEHAAAVLLALTTLHVFHPDARAAHRWGQRALAVSSRAGLGSIEASAAAVLAFHELRLGNIGEAHALLERARPAVATSRAAEPWQLEPSSWAAVTELWLERFEDALRVGDHARALARRTGQGRWLPQIAIARAWSLWFLGRLGEALSALEEGAEMAQLTGNRQFEGLVLSGRAQFLTAAGRLAEARMAAERAIDLAGPPAEGDQLSLYSRERGAMAALAAGDPETARRLIRETMDERGVSRTEEIWQPIGLGVLTEAELALGDREAAGRHASRSMELAETFDLPLRRSWAMQALASVQLARDEAPRATATAFGAVEAAHTVKAGIDEGRALTLAGRALAAAGDRTAAVRELRRAYELLDACGALHFRDHAARELRHLGQRVGRAGRPLHARGTQALSARERDIAELVAEGRTNKEIAAALFIAGKTVEKHLSNIFQKLDVSKRAQVAAAIERERTTTA